MRALVPCFLFLAACSSDSFRPSDGGNDANTESGSGLDGGSSDAISSDGHVEDVVAKDVVVDAVGPEASTGPQIQCNPTNTQQCSAPSQVCCGNSDWSASSCTASSGCTSVGARPLACDDITDCPSNTVCCASVLTTSSVLVVSSVCQSFCNGANTQLCHGTAECLTGSCVALPSGSAPAWLQHCQ